ncbi:sensor histidine kinase [Kitasatospora sp. NBC_00315]|uniref:sensor histidine kinase n=1 Tax=Kitasatospora sp. NBC_00315 TaxID=2975963 RepID=UPI00324C584A
MKDRRSSRGRQGEGRGGGGPLATGAAAGASRRRPSSAARPSRPWARGSGPSAGALLPLLVAGAAVAWAWRQVRDTRTAAEAYREQGRLEERGQLGRDVHDTVAQGLAAIAMLVRAAELALGRDQDADTVRERLAAIRDVAALSLGQANDLTHGAAYSELDTGGLAPAVRNLVALTRRTLAAGAELLVEHPHEGDGGAHRLPELVLETTGGPRRLALPVESAVLRMIQEATSNAIRHSGASTVRIRLEFGPDRMRARVEDDGRGLEPGAGTGVGLGLAGLERRIGALGGRLLMDSTATGTVIAVEFPYQVAPSARRDRPPHIRRPAKGPGPGGA